MIKVNDKVKTTEEHNKHFHNAIKPILEGTVVYIDEYEVAKILVSESGKSRNIGAYWLEPVKQ